MLSNFDAEEDFWESLASKEIKPVKISLEYSFEGLWLKWKLQYFGHLMWRANSLERTLMLGKIESQRRRGQQRLKMVEWHHWLDGHAFEQTPIDSEGQGSLVCCSPWGCQELDKTEQLNKNNYTLFVDLLSFGPCLCSITLTMKLF